MDLGSRLKTARLERKMTLAALAEASQLSKGFISQVEAGQSMPSLASLQRLTSSLAISIASVMDEDADVAQEPSWLYMVRSNARVFRSRASQRGAATFAVVMNTAEAALATASLPTNASLRGAASGRNQGHASAFCIVLGGAVTLAGEGTTHDLMDGDAASWDASKAYSIENHNARAASLFIMLPLSCDLPALDVEAGQPRTQKLPFSFGPAAEGPLRLVAMRAQRATGRGR